MLFSKYQSVRCGQAELGIDLFVHPCTRQSAFGAGTTKTTTETERGRGKEGYLLLSAVKTEAASGLRRRMQSGEAFVLSQLSKEGGGYHTKCS